MSLAAFWCFWRPLSLSLLEARDGEVVGADVDAYACPSPNLRTNHFMFSLILRQSNTIVSVQPDGTMHMY